MAEYIEREAALSAQNKSMNLSECRKRLERIPASDVRPVVHGKWIHTDGKFSRNKTVDRRVLTCSICGNMLFMGGVNAGRGDANFCPNCGADMREES